MNHLDDEFILRELRKGTEYGLSIFTSKYQPYLMQAARRWYRLKREDAVSCVDDNFLKALDAIDEFRPENDNSLRKWLEKILRNTFLDFVKTNSDPHQYYDFQEDADSDDWMVDVPEEFIKKCEEEFSGPNIREDDRIQIVYEILTSFSDNKRSYLNLRLMGYKHSEIAKIRDPKYQDLTDETNPEFKRYVEATRQYINRLEKKFCEQIAKKLNIDGALIHENLKNQNRQSDPGSDVGQ